MFLYSAPLLSRSRGTPPSASLYPPGGETRPPLSITVLSWGNSSGHEPGAAGSGTPAPDLPWENPYRPNTFYHRKHVRYLTGCATSGQDPHPRVIAPLDPGSASGSGEPGSPRRQGIPAPKGRPSVHRDEARTGSPHLTPPAGRHPATPSRFIRIPKSGQYVLLVIVCPSDVPSSYSWRLPRSTKVCALPSHCPTVSRLAELLPPMVSTAAESARSAEPGNHVPGVNQRTCAP